MPQLTRLAALALIVLVGACARTPVQPLQLDHLPAQVELRDTPFHPQDAYQCGPAALATLLGQRGIEVSPEALAPSVYLPERRGSLQVELIASARRHGLLVYPLAPSLEALMAELAAGNPVLVLQNLGFKRWPRWHYAVVVGYDRAARELILRSGSEARQRISWTNFDRTWVDGGRWGILTLPPERLPAQAEATRWLQAASDLEETGQTGAAERAYATAIRQWPDAPLPWFALGNLQYAQGQTQAAEDSLRRAVATHPPLPAAWHNLAQLLSERGCAQQAAEAARCAQRLNPDDARLGRLAEAAAETRRCAPPPACPAS